MYKILKNFSLLVKTKTKETEIYSNLLEANEKLKENQDKKDFEGAYTTKYPKGGFVVKFEFPEDVKNKLMKNGYIKIKD